MNDAHVPDFRILWADERTDQREHVRSLLADVCEVQLAASAEAALELAHDAAPSLVCAGGALHTLRGVPLLCALRALPALGNTTLLLSCTRGQEASLSEELLAAADDLLLSPFSARELRMRIAAYARAKQTRRLEQDSDVLLSSLGHELRTPLSAILLWTSSLRRAAASGEVLNQALEAITSSAQAQSRRIDELLDLSRLSLGKLALDRHAVSVATLLRDAHEEHAPLALAKHITLRLELREPLGEVLVDPRRFTQVLANLLSNAIKFTPAGGFVTLRAERHDTSVEFEVSDTGEGIAAEFMPHLFQRFQQGSAGEARRHPGLGIGLALSQQLVQLHGGTIEAHSEGSGSGASFRVRLHQPRSTSSLDKASRQRAGAAQKTLQGRTVLLIEDHEETREAMQFVLERAGSRVLSSEDGLRALTLLGLDDDQKSQAASSEIDVIVCDLGLPDMTGYEFIARLAQAYEQQQLSPPPACAVSAHAREGDRLRAIRAGFDLHLAKPLAAHDLIEAVDDLCQVAAAQTFVKPSPRAP